MSDQMANPFRKPGEPGPRVPPPSRAMPAEWARLYVMGLVFLLAVGTMIYMAKMIRPAAPAGGGEPSGNVVVSREAPAVPSEAPGAEGEPGSQQPPPGRRKEIPLAPLPEGDAVPYRELAAPFRDGEEPPVKETPEFVNLLNVFLNAVRPEAFSKAVDPQVQADRAFLEPDRHRGTPLRTYGRLIRIFTEPLDCTTPNNVERVYFGVMQEYKTNRTVCFYLPELPRDPATGKPLVFRTYRKGGEEFYDDWVEVEGIFLRRYIYPSRMEGPQGQPVYAKSALLFAKNIRLSPRPQYSDHRTGFIVIVSLVASVIVAIVLVAGIASRKYGSGDLRMKLLSLRRARKGKEPVAVAPPADAPPASPPTDSSSGGGTPPPA